MRRDIAADAQVQRAVEDHLLARTSGGTRVGVVFVHGIGTQPESDTVREFGGALLSWLQEWHAARELDLCVASSDLSYGEQGERPARFSIDLPQSGTHGPQTWILSEAWWGARLSAPTLDKMFSWGLQAGFRVIGRLSRNVDEGLARHAGESGRLGVIKDLIVRVSAVFLLAGYLMATVAAVLPVIVFYLLAQIPGPVERAVLSIRQFLLEQLGDFYTYMYDDIQAVHIRRSVAFAVGYLVEVRGCERIAVIAHSQGTVVAYDALASGSVPHLDKVKTLVTFGAALNNAWQKGVVPERTCRLCDPIPGHIRWINVWSAYDPVVGGPVRPPIDDRPAGQPQRRPPDEDLQVTNWMNVILDHGGYFINREEFLSRLAQELESPGDPASSRFMPAENAAAIWTRRRRDRVLTLVGWRLFAMIGFGAAMLLRMRPLDRLRSDGETIWTTAASWPVVGGALTFIDQNADLLAFAEPFGARVLGIALWLVPFAALYIAITWLAFVPWHDAEGRRSTTGVSPRGSQTPQIVTRSAAVLVGLTFVLNLIADWPALGGS